MEFFFYLFLSNPLWWAFGKCGKIILAGIKMILPGVKIILPGGKIILAGGQIILAGGKIILAGGKIINNGMIFFLFEPLPPPFRAFG